MIEKGLPESEVMRLLEETRKRDYSYKNAYIGEGEIPWGKF